MKLLISGGAQRSDAAKKNEGHRYYEANLIKLDFDSCSYDIVLSKSDASENYPDKDPNITFTSATLVGKKLYICTETEVFIYSYPELNLINSASYPFFQNSHHISPVENMIGVASTGLDLVVLLDQETLEPVEFLNSLGKEPWHKFDKNIDYRKINSTKPHESHPNFIFELNGEVWTTRFNQKDAVCLRDMSKRINIGVERIHDGHVVDGYVYFTSVDGNIIIVDAATYKIKKIYKLNEMEKSDMPLGWCRGLLVKKNIAYVAFTQIRPTPIKENVKWLLSHIGRKNALPTRIVAYDLEKGQKIAECLLPKGVIDAVYSVLDAEV